LGCVAIHISPILGWHLHVDIIVNPIIDTAYDGAGNLDFAPSTGIAYNRSKRWALAVEEYDDFGPVHRFHPIDDESHELWVRGVGFSMSGLCLSA